MTEEKATVFVVDDDPSVRKALTRLLKVAGLNVKTFASAREFLAEDLCDGLGCLILDFRMPNLSGLDLQMELASRKVQMPIVFISGHADISTSVRAMKSGAVDFLTKPFKHEDLLAVVREALRQGQRLESSRVESDEVRRRIETLTPREREVMDLVVQGRLNKQIAAELGAALKTIKVHRGRVMEKMQVQSVAELVHAIDRLKGNEDRGQHKTKVS